MSKLRKNKTKSDDNPNLLKTETLEEKVRTDLDQHNYRRAKEWLKELCRRNKSQYLPQLIGCYHELAKQMLKKGLIADAKTIFDQIRFLTGGKMDPDAEAQLAISARDYPAAAKALIRQYGDGKKPPGAKEGRFMADALLVAFDDAPHLKEKHPQLYEELTAVQKALACVCFERYTDALGELRRIPLQSIFSDWRLFIKGLCAFYGGQNARAIEAFQRLTDDTLLSRAARPFILIMDQNTNAMSKDEPREPLLIQVCQVLNRPDMAPVLPRAEYLWRLRRYADSYAHVAQSLKGFPTEEQGLLHTLSLFYFNAVFHMDDHQANKYVKGIHSIVRKNKYAFTDYLFFTRMRNLYFDNMEGTPDHEYLEMWEDFLLCYNRGKEENSKISALVYARLGDKFAVEEAVKPSIFYFNWRKQKAGIKNFKLAEESYENSLRLNGQDKDVHHNLLRLYESAGEHGKRNKKLDEIIRLFPDDKESLAKNGAFCIERKAFIKGIDFLKRAAALDPLDGNHREALCIAYIKASRHFAKEGNARRYREFMGDAIALGERGLGNMNLGRPYLKTRLAIFEWIAGCEEEGNRLWADVIGKDNDDFRLSYFACLIGRMYGVREPYLTQLQTLITPIFQNPTSANAAAYTDVIRYVRRIDPEKSWLNEEFRRLNKYAAEAADNACTPREAEIIIRYAYEQASDGEKLFQKYIKKMLAQDRRHPLFLYYQYLSERSKHFRPHAKKDLRTLEDILTIAEERNDRLLINILNKEIHIIEEILSMTSNFDSKNDWEKVPDLEKAFNEVIKKEKKARADKARADKAKDLKDASPRQKSLWPDNPQTSLFDDLD